MSATQIATLVTEQVTSIRDLTLREALDKLLVDPYRTDRAWDYGDAGQTYPCWMVLEHPASNTGIAYCSEGFGPSYPWGLVSLSGEHMSIGMDSAWYASLEDAFRESAAWDGENPPGYEVQ